MASASVTGQSESDDDVTASYSRRSSSFFVLVRTGLSSARFTPPFYHSAIISPCKHRSRNFLLGELKPPKLGVHVFYVLTEKIGAQSTANETSSSISNEIVIMR